jgi:hypothetical protein
MSGGFDAYHKWLGIGSKDQPPHYYRLLAIEAFESDPDVIETAADRQLASLRRYQSGEHAALASKLLNEVAQARLCLLKPESKQRYDRELRKRLDPAAAFETVVQPEAARSAVNSKTRSQAAASVPVWKKPAVMGGAAAAGVLVIIGILMLLPSSNSGSRHSRQDRADSTPRRSEPIANKQATPLETADEPSSATAAEQAAGPAINLLQPIDLQKQKFRGEITTATNGSLRFAADSAVRLPTHGSIPDDYRLDISTERLEGISNVFIAFPCSGRMTFVVIDGWSGVHSGLCIDGRLPNSNCTTHTGMVLAPNRTNEISIVVHPGAIRVTCDGKSIVDWKGNPDRLFADAAWGLPGKDELVLATASAVYDVSRFELTPLRKVKAEKPRDITKPVDLLREVNLAESTWVGKWIRDTSGLQSVSAGLSCIQLGQDFPEEYTLVLRTKRPLEQKGDPTMVVGFPAGESLAEFVFDRDDCCGLEVLEGRRWLHSITRIPGIRLKGGPEHEVRITVLKRRIALDIDGRRLLDWAGDFQRLSAPGEWVGHRPRGLSICTNFDYTIKAARLEPPQKLPEPPKAITTPIDLLKTIDTSRDAYWGDWTLQGGVLKSDAVELARLALPTQVPDEYTLTLDVTKLPMGDDDCLRIGLPMGDHFVQLAMDSHHSTKTGLELDDHETSENPTFHAGRMFEPGKQRTLVCRVSRTGIQVECDGELLINWQGNPCRRSVYSAVATPLHRRPFLSTWRTSYHFSRMELAPNARPMAIPKRPEVALGENLIKAILPDLDAQRGVWKIQDGALMNASASGSRLEFPVDPPPRYTLSMLVERTRFDYDFQISLPMGNRVAAVMIDGYSPPVSGLDPIDQQRAVQNPTRREGRVLPHGKTVQIDCIVTPDSVRVLADGEQIIHWQGDPRRLGCSPSFIFVPLGSDERCRLAIGSWEAEFKISQVVLRPVAPLDKAPPRLVPAPRP